MKTKFNIEQLEYLIGWTQEISKKKFSDKEDWKVIVQDIEEVDLEDCFFYEQIVFEHIPTGNLYAIKPMYTHYEGYNESTEADLTLYEVEPHSVIKYRAKHEK